MLTHTAVVDLQTLSLTDEWEQVEWVNPPVDNRLTDYIITAMEMLNNVGIPCEGVTSPGAFGKRQESSLCESGANRISGSEQRPASLLFSLA